MNKKKIREEVVAGMFYSGREKTLREQLEKYTDRSQKQINAQGIIVPHAGYLYSGKCAGKVYGKVRIPDTVIVLGVAHNPSYCPEFGIENADEWRTSLGNLKFDRELAQKIANQRKEFFKFAEGINDNEHSIEVQLPFLAFLKPEVRIVPVLINSFNQERIIEAGKVLAEVLKKEDSYLIVASTDMSHYISAEEAAKKDELALNKIKAMDPEGLLKIVYEKRISMCGVAPTAVMLSAIKDLGRAEVALVDYTHSGYVSGDYNQVVTYAGLIVN